MKSIDEAVSEVVATWPPLTPDQHDKVWIILNQGSETRPSAGRQDDFDERNQRRAMRQRQACAVCGCPPEGHATKESVLTHLWVAS